MSEQLMKGLALLDRSRMRVAPAAYLGSMIALGILLGGCTTVGSVLGAHLTSGGIVIGTAAFGGAEEARVIFP